MPSTVIANLNYDPDSARLSVWFRPSGRRYDYCDVPPEVYEALRHSGSKGRFFNRHIRNEYRCDLVEETAPAPLLRL
jgi:hypothetical protein